jgi:hypothetical protein
MLQHSGTVRVHEIMLLAKSCGKAAERAVFMQKPQEDYNSIMKIPQVNNDASG